ncbi:uncharacterized protein [Typha latifolia]|uniref:uncharacterized protein isoform X1 n=2 Tax=Typha latifolia TaxID=4733 RepID=UPI003C2B62FA
MLYLLVKTWSHSRVTSWVVSTITLYICECSALSLSLFPSCRLFSPALAPPLLLAGEEDKTILQEMETLEVVAGAASSPSRRRRKAAASASRLGSAQTLVPSGLPSHGPSADSSLGSGENLFRVGDFVWGKVKSNPWWPGKVLDTLENATGSQRKTRHLLVSFFGDVASAWCEQSQLKQFREEFEQMVKQSSSLSFVGAVTDALDEIRICLDSQNTCYCVREKSPAKVGESYAFGRLPITNYSVAKFLDHLCNVARDVMVADALEVTMLLSWAISFRQSDGCSIDLVGDNQIDDQPVDVAKDKMEEEFPLSDKRVMKRPEISKESKPRKERSIAELIAGPDIGKAEHCVDSGEKVVDPNKFDASTSSSSHRKRKKKGESSKNSIVDNGEYKAVQNTGSGGSLHDSVETGSHRRVRKMSKYLSPPYLYLSGYSKRSFLTDDATLGIPEEFKASETMPTESPQNLEGSQQVSRKEGDKIGPLFIDDGTSTDKILNELLATATNHLHLNWNLSANKVRNFFEKFRSYTHIEGSYFAMYQKFLDSLSSVDSSSIKHHDLGDGSGKGKLSWRRVKRKIDANQKTPLEKSNEISRRSPKTRYYDEKDKVIGETHLTVNLGSVNGGKEVYEKKRQKTKANAHGQNLPEPSHVLIDPLKECITRNTTSRGKMVDSVSTPVFISKKLANHSEASNMDRRNRKALNGSSVGVVQKPANGSEESNLKQKRKTKGRANSENLGALNVTFAPGSTLPSKDELVSAFVKFGILIESETELLKDSHSACVMFARAIDAKKAFKGLGEGGVLGTSVANYKLYFPQGSTNSPSPKSPVLKTPLPYIKKNLEKMIARLTGSTGPDKDMRSSNQLRPELASKLLGDMEGMLKKVNKLLTEPSSGTLV